MSAGKVTPSSTPSDLPELRPSTSPFAISARPSSKRLSRQQQRLSPMIEQTSLDLDLLRRREDEVLSRNGDFRRAKSDPQILPEQTMPWSENLPIRANTLSPFVNKRSQGTTNLHKDGHLISMVKAENSIREIVRRKYTDLKMAFQLLDFSKNGTVSKDNFLRVMKTFVSNLNDDQCSSLLLKVGTGHNDVVNYIVFLEAFRIGPVFGTPPSKSISLQSPRTADSPEVLESKVKEKLTQNVASFMKSVRLFDYNRDGNVQKRDLTRILESCGIRIQESQLDKILLRFAINRSSQSINYMDFLRNLGIEQKSFDFSRRKSPVSHHVVLEYPSNGRSSNQMNGDVTAGLTLGQIERKLREKIMKNFLDLQRAFVAFDRNRDGFVTLHELKRVLTHFVFPMSDQIFAQLMDRCGIHASHKISYDHFLSKFKHTVEVGNGQTIPMRPSHKVNPIREAISPIEVKELWERLRNHILSNYSSIKKAFLAFDDDKDGRVKRKEFRKVLDAFPFKLSEGQFDKLMERVDPEGKGYISYHEFLETFESKEGEGAHPWLNGDRKLKVAKPLIRMHRHMAHDLLCEKIKDNWSSISKAFMKADENNDGYISRSELRLLLHRFQIPITEDNFVELWEKCDENRDGKIQYEEFLKSLGIGINSGDIKGFSARITEESEEKIQLMKSDQDLRLHVASQNALTRTTEMSADEVIDVLKDHFIQRSADLRKTFLKYDYDRDGKLSKKEFRLTLQHLGLLMHNDQFKELTNRLGFNQGTISYSDFVHKFEEIGEFGEGGKTLYMDNHRYNKIKERSESMTAEEIEEIMRKKIFESFQTLRQAFYTVDANHDGKITRSELRRLLDSFMIPISDTEFDRLMNEKLKIPKNATISYREFVQKFQQNIDFQKGHPWLFANQNPKKAHILRNLTAQEAHTCLSQKTTDQWRDVSAAFRSFDKDGNSVVTKKELRTILSRFNIQISKEEFKKLWLMYDADYNGYVDHAEFLQRLGVDISPGDVNGVSNQITKGSEDEIYRHHHNQLMKQHKAAMNQANTTSFMSAIEIENKLRDMFRKNYESFHKAFEQMDTNKDGLISRADLMKVLFEHHFYMSDDELVVLLNRLGFESKNFLSYTNFLSAFEDPRHSNSSLASTESHSSLSSKTNFEIREDMPPEAVVAKLRKCVPQNAEAIRNAFGAFDGSGSGRISIDDLHRIINSFCFKISHRQFKHLLSKMTANADNTVDYESFMDSFQLTDSEASKRWLEKMLRGIKSAPSGDPPSGDPPSDREALEEKIGLMVKAKDKVLLKAFSDLDVSGTGLIDQGAFRRVLDKHTLRLSDGHFSKFCNKFDDSENGKVNYQNFLRYFCGTEMNLEEKSNQDLDENEKTKDVPPKCPESPIVNNNYIQKSLSAIDIEEKIKLQLQNQWKSFSKSCRALDQSNTGEIPISKVKDLLESHNIVLSTEEMMTAIGRYDSGNGRVKYMDWIKRYMMQSSDQNRCIPVSKSFETENTYLNILIVRLKREIRDEWKQVRRMFKANDRSATGTCTAMELKQTLQKFKILVNDEEFYHLMTYFDKNMTGKVNYNEFLKVLLS